jgi:hypothetical protein
MSRLDWKSVVIGVVLGVSIIFGIGAANQTHGDEAPKKPEAHAVGRFQIVAAGDHKGVTVMVLDTVTGQIWHGGITPEGMQGPSGDFLAPKINAKK